MKTADILQDLQRRIVAGYPILMLQTHEEQRWEDLLAELVPDLDRGLITWSVTAGPQPVLNDGSPPRTALEFLEQLPQYPSEHVFLLKDFHVDLDRPEVVRKLRDLLPVLRQQKKTLLLISPVSTIPVELAKDVTAIELPLPDAEELREVLRLCLSHEALMVPPLAMGEEIRLVQAALGLTAAEARRAFSKILLGVEQFDEALIPQLVAEKRHLIQGSNLLEFFDLEESLRDVGGLEALKEWIEQRAMAFRPEAQTRGMTTPRGVLLAGVQGCGKSLSARVIARILGFPLVRMDMGRLLESTRGGSEQNLREVLQLMEAISPAVLWLEELDKAFAGFDDDASNDATMSRLVGRFLTWMQEHQAPVFVVATANNVAKLPPEMLRRGRFDELFFVDLPNYHERQEIYRIHLSKRGWNPEKFDLDALAELSDGFSGAEIEEVVNSAIIESFADDRMPTQADLLAARERTVPLSVTMEDEIFALREWARSRCRAATPDFRVMQVMEDEERKGELVEYHQKKQPRWMQLAEHGQFGAAILDFIDVTDNVTWPQLIQQFEPYFPTRGDYGLVFRSDTKIVICVRISLQFAELLGDFIDGRRLFLHPVTPQSLPAHERPQLPAITELPSQKVDRAVWLPTTLRLIPPPQGSGRFARVIRIRMGK